MLDFGGIDVGRGDERPVVLEDGTGESEEIAGLLVVDERRQQKFAREMIQPECAKLLLDGSVDALGAPLVGPTRWP